jgi:hypothetical protein
MTVITSAIAAFVVCGIVTPSKAQAACGHYAHPTVERKATTSLLNLDILNDNTDSRNARPQLPGRCPCSGPSCSEGPSQPDAPIPPTTPLTGERWLAGSVFTDLAALSGSRLQIEEPSPRPVNRPGALERPPRTLPA